jgi:cytochrome c556
MTRKLALLTAMVVAVGGAAAGGSAIAQGIDPIQTRQTGLDLLAGDFAGIKAVIVAKGDVKTLEGPAKAIVRWGKLFPTLFPAGSDTGDTKASPKIWTENADFVKASMRLSTEADALATAAKAGDEAAVATAFKGVGDACGACHKEYRLK